MYRLCTYTGSPLLVFSIVQHNPAVNSISLKVKVKVKLCFYITTCQRAGISWAVIVIVNEWIYYKYTTLGCPLFAKLIYFTNPT